MEITFEAVRDVIVDTLSCEAEDLPNVKTVQQIMDYLTSHK